MMSLIDVQSLTQNAAGRTPAPPPPGTGAAAKITVRDFDFYYGVAPHLAEFTSIDQPTLFESKVGLVKGYVQRSMRISPSKRDYG